jgi:ABC-type multidrug transport system permease subunit
MVLQAPIIAILICCIFKNVSASVLFISSVAAIWFGTNNASREIVSENSIYKRERMFNLSIVPYLFSKISVLTFFSVVQTFLFVVILFVFYNDSSVTLNNPHIFFLWMLVLSVAATCLGLFLSSVLKTTESVMSFVPLVLLPQIMLAGIIAKIDNLGIEILSYLTISRWGTEGFAIIQENIIEEMQVGIYSTIASHEYILSRFHKDFQEYNLNGNLSLDLYAVLFIIFIMLVLTYFSLKRKDQQSL